MTRSAGVPERGSPGRALSERGSKVEPVRLTNEVPVPTVPQPQGSDGPNEAEAAQLAALQQEAQEEEAEEEG